MIFEIIFLEEIAKNMEYTLFFDVETTGLLNTNPYIVSIAYSLYEHKPNQDYNIEKPFRVLEKYHIVKPPTDDFVIPEESVKVHGISTEQAKKEGISIQEVIYSLHCVFDNYNVKMIVAHNINFDIKVLMIQLDRYDTNHKITLKHKLFDVEVYCTMKETIEMMNLERTNSRGTYKKYPKLEELYTRLFKGEAFNAHNALEDVRACVRCYYKFLYKIDIY